MGVGPIVALSYIATLDDEARLKRATDVGAFLGLTLRRYQSRDMDCSGRIRKCGDRDLRRLLCAVGFTLISQVQRASSLQAWAARLSERKGIKYAAIAAARNLAVIMQKIWRDGTTCPAAKAVQAYVQKTNTSPKGGSDVLRDGGRSSQSKRSRRPKRQNQGGHMILIPERPRLAPKALYNA